MTLTIQAVNPALDLVTGIGQRSATFTFSLVNAVSGLNMGTLTPLRGATLTHSTDSVIKRRLNMSLGVVDTAAINPLTDRVDVAMLLGDVAYPLGRYMFTSDTRQRYTSGSLGSQALSDEMFLIDQEIEAGINGRTLAVTTVISNILAPFDVDVDIEGSDYTSAQSWGPGARRGQILDALALTGDFFSPWFGNDGRLHFIRAFDPALRVPDFDFDTGNRVLRESIVETSDLLTAPNRIVVISNSSSTPEQVVSGTSDIPVTAPHSVPNRGFVIPKIVDYQVSTPSQATAIARTLALSESVLEYVNLATPPDPRHDSYDVIQWQGKLWLETGWSMKLVEGGRMSHVLRRAYT